MFGTATSDDWKQKYRDLLEELERKERDATELADALRGVATRLAIAAMGRDPMVDNHLDDIIDAIKSGAGDAQLNGLLEQLASAVVEQDKGNAVAKALDLSGFVASLPIAAADQRRHIDALETDSATCRATALQALATELNARLTDSAAQPKQDLPVAIRSLLSRVETATSLSAAMRDIRSQLDQSGDCEDALKQLGGVVADAVKTLDQDKTELEVFLEEVTRQLGQFEALTDSHQQDARARARDSNELEQAVDSQVGALQQEMDSSADLKELKGRVRSRMDNIAERLVTFKEREVRRAALATERHSHLREEVDRLRARTSDLAAQCAAQESRLMHDELTGVYSRYAYSQRLDEEYKRWQRHGMALSYSIWDIDFFKRINDSFGHQAGDRLLAAIGALLARHTRAEDFVARIGGEEFVILFPATTAEGALIRCESLREQLAGASFRCKDEPLEVTMSCGLTQFSDTDTPQRVYERADAALYLAKEQGRNRCVKN
ncbi:MAG: diguanylate cyclase [Gammaproteobacteria bacterium]